jgi:hypothetical protein
MIDSREEEEQNACDSLRINSEYDSNEIDKSELQSEKLSNRFCGLSEIEWTLYGLLSGERRKWPISRETDQVNKFVHSRGNHMEHD